MQEYVEGIVSTKMWEILYLYVLFLFGFHTLLILVFPTSPIMCGSVGSGDPLVIIVKVLSTELCVLCRVARHLVNLLLRFFMFEYSVVSNRVV
jgi:hypothetical protein